ncbi:glycosyltransferase family 2 protein [Oxynema aestuarii]|uniref:glycosyltransferase family 2 protein n=1 Tax=Oxynema aestuarii TaxID=2874213 RepID=UPI001FE537DD|nr:glycosyltransferase family A protein [Oxynema aestuarii]
MKGKKITVVEERQDLEIQVSVIIPCFNQGEYLLEAIASVESCQDSVWEIVIVNDGSTDEKTQKVLSYLKQQGYRIIDSDNRGLAAARNLAIEQANGDYILPLDSDNRIKAEYIPRSLEILEDSPEIGIVYSWAEIFGEENGIREVPPFDINRLMRGNYIDACAVFRKAVWQDCGGFDSQIPEQLGYEDWDFWLGAAEKGWQFACIEEALFEYRFRPDSMVSRCNIPENRKQLFRYICAKHIGLYASNFANVFAEIECDKLKEEEKVEDLEERLAQTQVKLEFCESLLAESEAKLRAIASHENSVKRESRQLESQLKQEREQNDRLSLELEQLRDRLRVTQSNLAAETQTLERLQRSHQEECDRLKHSHEQTQNELERQLEDLRRSHQQQLEQTKNDFKIQIDSQAKNFERTQTDLTTHIHQLQFQVEHAHLEIEAMKTSKFWKLRTQWFKLKKKLGGAKENI